MPATTTTETKRADRRDAKRESILDAALHCFVERGFHGTAIPPIARRAGIAAGTIYHYFDSKEALVNALYRKWKGEVAQRVFTAFPQSASFREQFSTIWKEMLAFALEHPAAFVFIELYNHKSYLDAESQAVDRQLKDFARMVIAQAQSQGELKPLDATVLMELAFGAFNSLMRANWEGRIELTDDVIAGAEKACWDTVTLHS